MVGGADLIVGQPVGLQVGGTLVELAAVLEADTVYDQVAVQNVGVDVSRHQHLEVWKLPLGQLQANSMCLLGRQAIRCRKELDEVVVLPAICFNEPLLGELYLLPRRRGSTVPA